MIELRNITFRYNDRTAPVLRDVSVRFGDGESVCVMGANGSGKSTFAKLIAGLVGVQQGHLFITNSDNRDLPVGMIFQNPDNQMVAVTVEKELAFALENLGVSQDRMGVRIAETLERFRIAHLRQRLTTELSGGEKQRVALASIMIFEPDVLILDEPDSFLDQEGRLALYRELEMIRQRKSSMIQIHITQYPSVAERYKRLLVFEEGRLTADDRPDTVFADKELCERAGLAYPDCDRRQVNLPGYIGRSRRVSSITLKNVSFAYDSAHPVVQNVSLKLRAGKILAVVGPSGSGKSTLGNIVCGLFPPSSGEVIYESTNGSEVHPKDKPGIVSAVFQSPERQFFLPTAEEEVLFGPRNVGRRIDRTQKEDLFAMAGLGYLLFHDRDPFTLSGGEKRRLAFSAVLSMSPDFVVFDEPTCGLDPEGAGRFICFARALKDRGIGLLVVSHDGEVVNKLADEVLLVRRGCAPQLRTVSEFFSDSDYATYVSPVRRPSSG